MDCPPQNVIDYCSRKLSSNAAAEFERHMRVCSDCRSRVESQQQVWQALDAWEAPPVSADFDRQLRAQIAESQSKPWWKLAWRPALSLGAASAAIAVVLVVYTPDTTKIDVEPEQVESALEDLEMLKQLSANGNQDL